MAEKNNKNLKIGIIVTIVVFSILVLTALIIFLSFFLKSNDSTPTSLTTIQPTTIQATTTRPPTTRPPTTRPPTTRPPFTVPIGSTLPPFDSTPPAERQGTVVRLLRVLPSNCSLQNLLKLRRMNLYDSNGLISYNDYRVEFAVESQRIGQYSQSFLSSDQSDEIYGAENLKTGQGSAKTTNEFNNIIIQCIFEGGIRNITGVKISVDQMINENRWVLRGSQLQIFNLSNLGKIENNLYYPNKPKQDAKPIFAYSIIDEINTLTNEGFTLDIDTTALSNADVNEFDGYKCPFPSNLTSRIKYIRLQRYESGGNDIGELELDRFEIFDTDGNLINPTFYNPSFKFWYSTSSQQESSGIYSSRKLTFQNEIDETYNFFKAENLVTNTLNYARTVDLAPIDPNNTSLSITDRRKLIIDIELNEPKEISKIILIKKNQNNNTFVNVQLQTFTEGDMGKEIGSTFFPNRFNKAPMYYYNFSNDDASFFPSKVVLIRGFALFPKPYKILDEIRAVPLPSSEIL